MLQRATFPPDFILLNIYLLILRTSMLGAFLTGVSKILVVYDYQVSETLNILLSMSP